MPYYVIDESELPDLSEHSDAQIEVIASFLPDELGDWDEAVQLCANTPGSVIVDDELQLLGDHEQCKEELLEEDGPAEAEAEVDAVDGVDGAEDDDGSPGRIISVLLEVTDLLEDADEHPDMRSDVIGELTEETWEERYDNGGDAFDRIASVEFNGGQAVVLDVEREGE